MRDSYSQEDLNNVIGQVSKEISKLTGMPKDELLPSLKLSEDLRLSSYERLSLEVAFENRFHVYSQGMLSEAPAFSRRRSSFGINRDDLSIEDVAVKILDFQPAAAQIGEAFDNQQTPQTLTKKEPPLPADLKIRTHD